MGRKNEYTTKSRTRILECLRENADQTITVNAIQSFLEREDKSVNLTTIYRYLDKLNKEGLVMKYASNKDDTATYQIISMEHHCQEHLHIQCSRCNRVVHIDCGFMQQIEEHMLEHHGFTIDCSDSILHGLCENCRTAQEN